MHFSALKIALGSRVAYCRCCPSFVAAQRGGMFQRFRRRSRHQVFDGAAQQRRRQPQSEARRKARVRLAFEGRSGYLRTALAALEIPVDSQMLVFSPTSLQAPRISAANPRALFFTDRVVLGWVRDGDVLEVAAHDATQGVVFYTLDQRAAERAAVQAGDHLPRMSLRRPDARRPRPPDVQHETGGRRSRSPGRSRWTIGVR